MIDKNSNICAQCGAPADSMVNNCKFCGADLGRRELQVSPQQQPQQVQQQYVQQQYVQQQGPVYIKKKNKIVAGLLAIFLGGFGIHKFYLGKWIQGIIYLLLCWTYIPGMIAFIEGIVYLVTSEAKFDAKYSKRQY